MQKSLKSVVSTLALVLAFLIPAQPAVATGTKAFTVTDEQGNAVQGATVGLMGFDPSRDTFDVADSGDTDSSGQVSLTWNQPDWLFFKVSAHGPDSSYAHFEDHFFLDPNSNENLSIQLSSSDIQVHVKNPDGTSAGAGTEVNIQGSQRHLVTTGPVGFAVDVDAILDAEPNDRLVVTPQIVVDSFQNSYNIDASLVISENGQDLVATGGVYDLTFNAGNITGQLLASDGVSSQALPTGVTGAVHIMRADANGFPIPGRQRLSMMNDDGSFDAFYDIELYGEGTYVAVVMLEGDYDLPTFVSDPFAVDGSTGMVNLAPSIPSEAPNVRFEALDADGVTNIESFIDFFEDSAGVEPQEDRPFLGPNASYAGFGSILLPDGVYEVVVSPFQDLFNPRFYSAEVSAGQVTKFTKSNGAEIVPDGNGVYSLLPSIPNLTLELLDGDGNPVSSAWVNPYPEVDGECVEEEVRSADANDNGVVSLELADGDFCLRIESQNPDIRGATLLASMSGGSVSSLTDESGNPIIASNDTYTVVLEGNNFKAKATTPDGSQPIDRGYVNLFEIISPDDQSWIAGNGIRDNGTFGLQISAAGIYMLEVTPQTSDSTLASAIYYIDATEESDQTISFAVSAETAPVGVDITPTNEGVYELPVNQANITGTIVDSNGDPVAPDYDNDFWISVELLDISDGGQNYIGNTQVSETGSFNFYLADLGGEYIIKARPEGRSDLALGESQAFLGSAVPTDGVNVFTVDPIVLGSPDALVKIRQAGASEDLVFASLELREVVGDREEQISWLSTGPNGVAGVVFGYDGTFKLVANPSWENPGGVRKSYTVTVTDDLEAGDLIVNIGDGAVLEDGVWILELGTPSVSGKVLSPDGTSTVRWTQVIPVNENGRELWEDSANTDQNGDFSMSLPEGTFYLYARGDSQSGFGDSRKVGPITVDSNGTATAADLDLENLRISLREPTWSGQVVDPTTGEPLSQADVCLLPDSSSYRPICSWTGDNGNWSIAAPEDFDGFDQLSWLRINEHRTGAYAEAHYEGAEEIEAVFSNALDSGYTWAADQTYSGIDLSPQAPNFEVTVTAGGSPVENAWVSVDADSYGYISGNRTDDAGDARLYIPSIAGINFSDMRISVDLGGTTLLGEYASLREPIVAGAVVDEGNGNSSYSLALAQPNFVGRLVYPSGPVAEYSHLELRDSTGQWLEGINVGREGVFTANLADNATYEITARVPWDSTEDVANSMFSLAIDGSGNLTLTDSDGNPILPADESSAPYPDTSGTLSSAYYLELASPNISGTVVDPDGSGVRDSRVEIVDYTTREGLWDLGVNSRLSGEFSMNLDSGSYDMFANVPWNMSGVARSAFCEVTVDDFGVASSADSSCYAAGSFTLALREPNLNMTLVDPDGNPVRYGNVGVSLGMWNTWTQTDSQGRVSLFIDQAIIKSMNPDWTSGERALRFNFEPPWGDSNMVRFECEAGDPGTACGSIPLLDHSNSDNDPWGSGGTEINLGDVAFPEPNTRFEVKFPDGTAVGEGAWVSVFIHDDPNNADWMTWVGGGNTDNSGIVALNLPDTNSATTYTFEVNAPWRVRSDYSAEQFTIPYGDVGTTSFQLSSPNLSIEILDTDGITPSKWSWVGVEKLVGAQYQWQQGYGTDRLGKAGLNLDDGEYRLRIFPGPFSSGSETVCEISVTGGAFSLSPGSCDGDLAGTDPESLSVELSAGNFQGSVEVKDSDTNFDGQVFAGAIVYLEETTSGEVVQTTSDESGDFAVQLSDGTWSLSLLYLERPGDEYTPASRSDIQNIVVSGGNTAASGDVFYIGDQSDLGSGE